MTYVMQRLLSHTYLRMRGLYNFKRNILQESSEKAAYQFFQNGCGSQEVIRFQHSLGLSYKQKSLHSNLSSILASTKLNILDQYPSHERFKIDPLIISRIGIIEKQQNEKIIEEPDQPNVVEKKAERMIVIRRKKMKKHKLKKLRKRMKFEWARRSQQREKKKEKAFLNELVMQIKEAENYSPEKEALEKRELIKKTFLAVKYEEMPKWYLKEIMAKEEKKKREAEEDTERLKILEELNKIYREKGRIS